MPSKYDFNHIALMWRPGPGHRRICVGNITVPKNGDGIRFNYNEEGIADAQKIDPNFCGYPGLPLHSKHFSSLQVSEVFFGRLINNSRNDVNDFYDFWLVDKNRIQDSLYVLAQTQGLSPTDTFEFVPIYFSSHKTSFITDIAGLSKINFDLSKLSIGDVISFKKEEDNPADANAILVCFNGENIGYIKQGHNKVFQRKNYRKIKLKVWGIVTIPGYEKLYVRVDI